MEESFLEPLLNKLFSLYTGTGEDPYKEEKISSLIYLLLLTITGEDENRELSNSRIGKALKQIHSSPWKKQNLNDLASICNLSIKQFGRIFKNETDRNPMDYIRFLPLPVCSGRIT